MNTEQNCTHQVHTEYSTGRIGRQYSATLICTNVTKYYIRMYTSWRQQRNTQKCKSDNERTYTAGRQQYYAHLYKCDTAYICTQLGECNQRHNHSYKCSTVHMYTVGRLSIVLYSPIQELRIFSGYKSGRKEQHRTQNRDQSPCLSVVHL